VTYLDLRGATAAQALDWVLSPVRLSWRLDGDAVAAGSAKRLAGESAWVYDVAAMALPLKSEIEGAGDDAMKAATLAERLKEFLAAVKSAGAFDDASAAWYAPGHLLIFADQAGHARVENLLATLARSDAKLTGEAAKLHTAVTKRLAERKDAIAKAEEAGKQYALAQTLDQYGWPLLAAAAGGEADEQALVELSIAWKDPEIEKLLAGEGRTLALSSAWMIAEAASALSENERLHELADRATKLSQAVADAALKTLEEKPDDGDAFASVLLAALARPGKNAYRQKALAALTAERAADSRLVEPAMLARSLLGDRKEIDRSALEKHIESGVAGDQFAALLAIACRRAGGEVWDSFRAHSAELIGKQPIRGEVVVLVNRLAGSRPILKSATR
jgi:hypothetical protein